VCVAPATGRRDGREPLLTLTAERLRDGRPRFGILLAAPLLPRAPPLRAGADEAEDDAAWMAQRFACTLRVGERLRVQDDAA
jgi:hypothetical protein